MTVINTTLTTAGNSVAVRLPKELLKMSGLGSKVTLEAKQGRIIIRKSASPRANWGSQIQALVAAQGDPGEEFAGMQAGNDGLDELPWEGISFQEWQKNHAKLS